jgi:cobalt-zinc-cadmium efflux system protein
MAHSHAHGRGLGRDEGGRGDAPAVAAARRSANRNRMLTAAAINAAMFAVGVVGGLITGSLALLADAGHVLSDLAAIALALFAARLASRAAGPRRTFGYQRSEVIAALVNGLALAGIAIAVVVGAVDRLGDPPAVKGAGVVVLGVVSLVGNLGATWVLARGQREDLNLEAVLRHSAADALGALGVVISGVVILATDWKPIDPVIAIGIALLILASSVRLIREPFDVLMEATPAGVDADAVARALATVRGVRGVHELHVWSVTTGFDALAAHVVVARGDDRDRVRREIEFLLRDRYAIEHTTLQMEGPGDDDAILQVET